MWAWLRSGDGFQTAAAGDLGSWLLTATTGTSGGLFAAVFRLFGLKNGETKSVHRA